MWSPRASASPCAYSSDSWKSPPWTTSSAPCASIAAFFSRLLPRGTTTTGVRPFMRAATATLWPKLPRVAAITPSTAGRSRRSRSM